MHGNSTGASPRYGRTSSEPRGRSRTQASSRGGRAVVRAAAASVETLERRLILSVTPIIDEFLAVNNTGLADEDGQRGDWLELHNPTSADVNLNGYFLSDSSGDLAKWRIPAVTLPSGGFLTIFADGKDRAVAGSTLHTNFSLSSSGGYLALSAPAAGGGVTVLSDYNYPQQVADKSYGVSVTQDITHLINTGNTARTQVPASGSLGTNWTNFNFDDSAWTAGTTGVGYETAVPASTTPGFLVRMVDTSGGTDGQINTTTEATALLDGTTPAGAFTIFSDTRAN